MKSDGGLFDFSDQALFCYYGFKYCTRYSYYPMEEIGVHIPAKAYITSVKENLFVWSLGPDYIAKFEDNDNAIDIKKMTQYYGIDNTPYFERFLVDNDENIYVYCPPVNGNNAELHIYYANGGFNAYEFEHPGEGDFYRLLDLTTDVSGVPYIFLITNGDKTIEREEDGSTYYDNAFGQFVLSASVKNGIIDMNENFFPTQTHVFPEENLYYSGYYNNCFVWCLRYTDLCRILLYNTNTHTCTLKEVSAELNRILVADYDAVANGSKTYCVNVKECSIEVTEVDIATETISTYNLNVNLPDIVLPTYMAYMIQDVPYLIIDGRNTTNGAKVSITVNLINGENNSTFASDTRNVVSFFRIN